ncbi:RNA polymerase sigma factor [Paraflavitalea speifideaquila]|uniref:RNA polymerase sigma factor n=1 Tax=Paraflavitalea speifideaquila TaxID=3076558 RepID=UPI0028E870A4|nr:sigma factor [Paraflavitalea speifideiaquila]
MYLFVKKMVKDEEDAKDIVDEAFYKYLCKQYQVHTEDELRALLYTICHNLALDHLRRFKHKKNGMQKTPTHCWNTLI